jgi:outer membrane protein OmpA-like peptidoglycan-associated protein/tetratricopeptide (TPR) repeat protein
MNKGKYILKVMLLLMLIVNANKLWAQPQSDGSSKNRSASKLFEAAENKFKLRQYKSAISIAQKAIDKDPNFINAYDLQFESYAKLGDRDNQLKTYRTLIQTVKPPNRMVKTSYYILATFEFEYSEFDSAAVHFKQFLDFGEIVPQYTMRAKVKLASALFSANAIKNPVPFNPINMGENINSRFDEYFPGQTLDGEKFIFTRKLGENYANWNEDFFISNKSDGKWQMAKNLGTTVNTEKNEGTISVSVTGKYIFFTACNRQNNVGSCDLYYAKYVNGVWGKPKLLAPPINSPYWDSQPSIASDGVTIYFTSARKGGYGGNDLWVAKLIGGKLSPPENLGPNINTTGHESTPFIHADGKTLYFASSGHPGMGKLDLFVSKFDNGEWTTPKNLGYPINTSRDEHGLVVDRTGEFGYLSSTRDGGYGGLDIYKFNLHKEIKPMPVSYVKGTVSDLETGKKLGCEIDLQDFSNGEQLLHFETDSVTGSFFIVLESNKDYAFTIDKLGYLFHSENFSLKQTTALDPYVLDIKLSKPKKGEAIVLNNVLFDTDKFDLKSESNSELNRVVKLLNENPTMKVSIEGHTDNQGSEQHNITLSKNRAKSVVDYLISKGISSSRLSSVGKGSSKPVADNSTAKGRKLNRRTELVIISQ